MYVGCLSARIAGSAHFDTSLYAAPAPANYPQAWLVLYPFCTHSLPHRSAGSVLESLPSWMPLSGILPPIPFPLACQFLSFGGMKYNDILDRTGASSATISRVNRSLVGGTGTYDKIFGNMDDGEA